MSQNPKLNRVRRKLNFDTDSEEEFTKTETSNNTNEATKTSISKVTVENKDHEEMKQDSSEEVKITDLSQMNQLEKLQFMQRWNFDFENGIPLEGDWEWEKLLENREKLNHKEKVLACFSKEDGQNKDV